MECGYYIRSYNRYTCKTSYSVKWIGKNIVDDVSLFRNDVHLDKKVIDSTGSAGTDGQQLLSTATTAVLTLFFSYRISTYFSSSKH